MPNNLYYVRGCWPRNDSGAFGTLLETGHTRSEDIDWTLIIILGYVIYTHIFYKYM